MKHLQLWTTQSSGRYTKTSLALVNQTKPNEKCTSKNNDKENFESCCQCLYFAAPKSFDPVFVYVYVINVPKWA